MSNPPDATTSTAPDRPVLGQHVWVRETSGWQAGLLTGWDRHPDGSWWGRVVVAEQPGIPVEVAVRADRLRPAAGRDSSTS